MIRGTPAEMGFVRAPQFDRLLAEKVGRLTIHSRSTEVWRTPEGVLLALPPDCDRVGLREVVTPRGTTLACLEPEGVTSVWPFKRGAKHGEGED